MPDNILPDSRLKRVVEVKRHCILGNTVPIFCANCHKEGGRVSEEYCTFAFWLCDECVGVHGAIANTMMIPDQVFWEQVRQDQLDREQRRKEAGDG